MQNPPAHARAPRAIRKSVTSWRRLGCALSVLASACGTSSESSKENTPPEECTPRTFSLRSLDGFRTCCEGEEPSSLGESLTSCDADAPDVETGAGGLGGSPGEAAGGLGGSEPSTPSAWVILTHPFEADWDGGSDVCLHITSTGASLTGDATLYTLPSDDSCSVSADARRSRFRVTEAATAYVCLNTNGAPLERPAQAGELAVAFRLVEGSAESLRVDAIDVKKDTCDE